MRKLFLCMLAGLLVVAFVVPTFAWEFSMKGDFEYRFRYFARTGNNDLFGQASLQEGSTTGVLPAGQEFIGFAGPNLYGNGATATVAGASDSAAGAGWAVTRGGWSTWGSDAFTLDQRLTLRPTIRVNKAIRVFGVYTVGGMRNKWAPTGNNVFGVNAPGLVSLPLERYGIIGDSVNAYDTAALGSWEQLRCTMYWPWGVWSIGQKDFPLGTGATTSFATRATSSLLVVPYGPFRLLQAVWLARSVANASYLMKPDGNDKADAFWGFIMTYDNADLDVGLGTIQRLYHFIGALAPAGRDQVLQYYTVYFKYNNGRFFSNAEYAWFTIDVFPSTNNIAGVIQAPGVIIPLYLEGYHFFAETGFTSGPLKFTAMYAMASGPVLPGRRDQVVNNWNRTKVYTPFPINYQAMRPYQWLMFEVYGGGNQTYGGVLLPSDGHGMMGDAYCFAGRIDYAVAANLNVWGSYIWAHRLEVNGTYFGQYDDTGANTGVPSFAAMANYGRTNPFVDDGYIGWEAQLGVDWKLLEGLTFSSRYAYWQPGNYFEQAWQGVGMVNGAVSRQYMYRTIDPIHAFEAKVVIDF